MKNKQKGIIFFSKKVKDNDLYIKILSFDDNVDSGMVYGGNSSKKKLIYQNGYFIDYDKSRKNENAPLIFTAEISKPFLGTIYNDKYKLYGLLSILSLIKSSIVDGQVLKGIYQDIEIIIYRIIQNDRWIINYCEWLFRLLMVIGYQIDYKKNLNNKYYNIAAQEFTNININNAIEFPHNLFTNRQINFKNIKSVFDIFESIYLKNHLDNIQNKMPDNFTSFKKIIISKLKI